MKSSRTWIHVLRLKGGKPTYSQKNRDLLQWHKACDSFVESLRHFTWTRVKNLEGTECPFSGMQSGASRRLTSSTSFFSFFCSHLSCLIGVVHKVSKQLRPQTFNRTLDVLEEDGEQGYIMIKEHFIIYVYIAFICGSNYHILRFFFMV